MRAIADLAEAGRWPEALAALLVAWRDTNAPALAALIEEVGPRAAENQRALGGKTVAAQRRWRALAKQQRPEELDPLLATWRDVPAAEVGKRAALLAAWPADPRRDRAIVALLHETPYRTTPAAWPPLCALVEAIADVRRLDELRALVPLYRRIAVGIGPTKLSRRVIGALEPAIARLAGMRVPATRDDEATARIRRAVAPRAAGVDHGARIAALRAAVFEHPDDPGVRAVFADALLEAGDPLGELIALSADPAPDRSRRARIDALTKQLLPTILGPLEKVVYRRELVLDRGFLARGIVNTERPQLLADVVDSSWWATVVELRWAPANLILGPALRSLRHVQLRTTSSDQSELTALLAAERPLAIETLSSRITPAQIPRLSACTALPALRHLQLDCTSEDPGDVLDAQLAVPLETLRLQGRWSPETCASAVLARACFARTVIVAAGGGELRFARGRDGRHTAVELALEIPARKAEAAAQVARAAATIQRLDRRRVTAFALSPSRPLAAQLQAVLDAASAGLRR